VKNQNPRLTNLGAVYSSDVDDKQAIIREDSRMQNAGFNKSCNFKLSRLEVLLTFFVLLCK